MGEDLTKEYLVASFMEVTGTAAVVDACDHLACCGWNLDEAVDLFLSVGAGPSGSRSPPRSSSAPDDDEEEANAARAQVVRPARSEATRGGRANDGDDRRRSSRSGSRWDSETRVSRSNDSRSSRRRRRRQRFRERDNDEEDDGGVVLSRRVRRRVDREDDSDTRIEVDGDLTSRLQLYHEALNSGKDKTASAPPAKTTKKEEEEKNLADLFRPPRELTFAGGFHDAKMEAARRWRWLLVNVHDTGEAALASFAQNRDVWANGLVARFVRDHFVLWQADAGEAQGQGAEEARKVCAHYGVPLDKLPAVLVVDPVTGQAMARLHGASTDPNDFLVAVKSYIATKPVVPVVGAEKPGASATEPSNQEPATSAAPASSQRTASRKDVPKVEKQDKAVPAVATVAPIVEKQDKAVAPVATVASTVEKQRKAVQAVVAAVPKVEPAPAPAPAPVNKVCKLRIRLPDGRIVTKEFASGRAVAALFAYCRSELGEGEAGKRKPFRLIRLVGCTREEIGDRNVSFENLGLHLSTVSVLLG